MNQFADMPQSLRITVVEDNESLCAVTVELLSWPTRRAQAGQDR